MFIDLNTALPTFDFSLQCVRDFPCSLLLLTLLWGTLDNHMTKTRHPPAPLSSLLQAQKLYPVPKTISNYRTQDWSLVGNVSMPGKDVVFANTVLNLVLQAFQALFITREFS